ncbi:MAG TPA: rhomboid family intramembrane serine protease [Verrucomicrobiae bacterium]|nr:rhomboid family intramembrane serine protease [Verrucomicrobiae bacterium]
MIEDRDYMREPDYGQHRWRQQFRLRWTWTTGLLAAYVVVLIVQQIAIHFFDKPGHYPVSNFVTDYLALSKEGLAAGYVWQLLTYQFLHAGWMHLILNSWVIFFFGNELEKVLGVRRYLTLLFSSGIVGGVFQVLAALAYPPWFGGPVVGASAAAFGLVAAFAMLFPEQELTMFLFFIIPVQLRAKMLLLASIVIAVVGSFFPKEHIANAAHLGGMAMGCFYVKKILNRALLGVGDEAAYYSPPPPKPVEKTADEFQDADVDTVLDKISARGINSLTARERAILEAARKKMAQR